MFLRHSTLDADIQHYLERHPRLKERLPFIEEQVKMRFPDSLLTYAVEFMPEVTSLDEDTFCGLLILVDFLPDVNKDWVRERIRLVNEAIEPFVRFSGGNLRIAPRFLPETAVSTCT